MDVKIIVETKAQMARLVDQLKASSEQVDRPESHRRERWRLMFATPGSIEMDASQDNSPIYVTTRDISVEGLGFLCRQQMEVGQKLVIKINTDLGEVEIIGTVRHCTATVGMYKVGLRFDLMEPDQN
jgi:c-di-GMP-binding flagellar brake protein YcgR